MRSRSSLAVLLLAACTALPLSATAQDDSPLKILVGFPPGENAKADGRWPNWSAR